MTPTRRIAATWYAYGYARELVLIFPVYAIMMGEHGVSPIELSILFFVWSASALIFEVPSGVLADRYSRKRILVGATLIRGSVFIIWWAAPEFPGYLIGFVLWSLGSSFVSGTSESFLFDTLRAHASTAADDRAFARVYGRGMVANSLGVATALLGGGYLAESGYACAVGAVGRGAVGRRRHRRVRVSSNRRAAVRRSTRAMVGRSLRGWQRCAAAETC